MPMFLLDNVQINVDNNNNNNNNKQLLTIDDIDQATYILCL